MINATRNVLTRTSSLFFGALLLATFGLQVLPAVRVSAASESISFTDPVDNKSYSCKVNIANDNKYLEKLGLIGLDPISPGGGSLPYTRNSQLLPEVEFDTDLNKIYEATTDGRVILYIYFTASSPDNLENVAACSNYGFLGQVGGVGSEFVGFRITANNGGEYDYLKGLVNTASGTVSFDTGTRGSWSTGVTLNGSAKNDPSMSIETGSAPAPGTGTGGGSGPCQGLPSGAVYDLCYNLHFLDFRTVGYRGETYKLKSWTGDKVQYVLSDSYDSARKTKFVGGSCAPYFEFSTGTESGQLDINIDGASSSEVNNWVGVMNNLPSSFKGGSYQDYNLDCSTKQINESFSGESPTYRSVSNLKNILLYSQADDKIALNVPSSAGSSETPYMKLIFAKSPTNPSQYLSTSSPYGSCAAGQGQAKIELTGSASTIPTTGWRSTKLFFPSDSCAGYVTNVLDARIQSTGTAPLSQTTGAGQAAETDATPGEQAEPEPSCSSEGGVMGWILCPLLTLMDNATGWLEDQIGEFLFVDQRIFDTDGGIYKSWSTFRGIATVIIVIIALIMIFSQSMGDGVFDNYSVKKLLPRLILAGIAIQLSWFLMVQLVNIFNVLGDGIGNLVLNPFDINPDGRLTEEINTVLSLPNSQGDNVTLFAGLAIGTPLFIGGFVGLAIGVFFALITGFITLIIRNMIIFLGIVFSPVAIAMSVLPGTQKTSKWWWESLEKALLMYPLVMVLLAAGKIVGKLLLEGAVADGKSTGDPSVLYMIAAIVAWYAPYFFIPKALQAGGQALGKLTGGLNDKSKGWMDKAKGWDGARKKTNKEYKRNNAFNKESQWWAKGGKNPLKYVGRGVNAATRTGAYLESGNLGVTNLKQSKVGRQQLEANAAAAKVKVNTFDLEAQKASLEAKEAEISTQNAAAKFDRLYVEDNKQRVASGQLPLDQRDWLRDRVTVDGVTGHERDAIINKLTEMKATKQLTGVAEHMITSAEANDESRAAWANSMVKNRPAVKAFAPQLSEARVADEVDQATGTVRQKGVANDKLFDDNIKAEDAKGWSKETWQAAADNAPGASIRERTNLVSAARSIYTNQTHWDNMGAEAQAHVVNILNAHGGGLPPRTW